MRKVLLALSLALSVSCGIIKPPNPKPPDPPAQTYSLNVRVMPAMAGVTVIILDNQNANTQKITPASGIVFFDKLIGPTEFTVCARLINYKESCRGVSLLTPETDHQDITLAITPLVTARHGQVSSDGFSLHDDDGHFLGLGTSLFWGLWGYQNDLPKLEKNLQTAHDAGFDYIRVFAAVGPKNWSDRTVDPTDPKWQESIAKFTNLVYDSYGMRVEWVIFAGIDKVPSPSERLAAVNKFLDAIQGIPFKVFSIEIANEAWAIGYNEPAELKSLAKLIKSRFFGLIATTSPQALPCNQGESEVACYCRAQTIWYDLNETFITQHFDRSTNGQGGAWRPIRQPWRGSAFSCPNNPKLYSNDEGIGPQSSVAETNDPLQLAIYQSTSYTAGIAAFTLHTGAGVQGGGKEDLARGRVANLWEVANWTSITKALVYNRDLLDSNLPNWSKGSSNPSMFQVDHFPSSTNPGTVDRVYCAETGNQYTCSVLNIRGVLNLVPKRNLTWSIIDPVGQIIKNGSGGISITSPQGVILTGSFQ